MVIVIASRVIDPSPATMYLHLRQKYTVLIYIYLLLARFCVELFDPDESCHKIENAT